MSSWGEYQFIVSEATVTEFGDTLRKYPEKFDMSEQEIQTEVTTVQMFELRLGLADEADAKAETDAAPDLGFTDEK